jgi:2-polyprenyl-6-methoxyphenol hydroxylase-like FAD-dependent oxidoreductase
LAGWKNRKLQSVRKPSDAGIMGFRESPGWAKLNVGVVGGGIGGMSVAIALRRAGHDVTVYERNNFANEVGASVSCAANGTRWLHEWGVDVTKGDPVILKKLINHWKTEKRSACMILTTMRRIGALFTTCFTARTCIRC